MSSSRFAKIPRRARRGLSLPGAALVVFVAGSALSFAIEGIRLERAELDNVVAARSVTGWARAADAHVFTSRATLNTALDQAPVQTITLANIEADPNTPDGLIDPTGAAQPLAGWTMAFHVVRVSGLPTVLIVLTPPADIARVTPPKLIATLARQIGGAAGDGDLDASLARSVALDAGVELDASDIVLFAHEYAGLSRDRFARSARPGVTTVSEVDIDFGGNAAGAVGTVSANLLTTANSLSASLETPNLTLEGDATAQDAVLANLEGRDARFTSARAPFSIITTLTAPSMATSSLNAVNGEFSAASSPLASISTTLNTTTATVTEVAQLPDLPEDATVGDVDAARVFAPAVILNALATVECPVC